MTERGLTRLFWLWLIVMAGLDVWVVAKLTEYPL